MTGDVVDGRAVVNLTDGSSRTEDDDFSDWIIHLITNGDVHGYANKVIREEVER